MLTVEWKKLYFFHFLQASTALTHYDCFWKILSKKYLRQISVLDTYQPVKKQKKSTCYGHFESWYNIALIFFWFFFLSVPEIWDLPQFFLGQKSPKEAVLSLHWLIFLTRQDRIDSKCNEPRRILILFQTRSHLFLFPISFSRRYLMISRPSDAFIHSNTTFRILWIAWKSLQNTSLITKLSKLLQFMGVKLKEWFCKS